MTALPSTAKERSGQFVHSFTVGSAAELRHHLLHDSSEVSDSLRSYFSDTRSDKTLDFFFRKGLR